METEELNNNEKKDNEYYLNKIIANQKKTIGLLRLNNIFFFALLIIKLFIIG